MRQAGDVMALAKVRDAIREQLAAGGVFARRIAQRQFDGALVLCYHGIRPDDCDPATLPFSGLHVTRSRFREHCEILARLCQPISLQQLRAARHEQRFQQPRPVVVTFDDGYRSVLTDALPLLEEFEIPAVVFACSDPIERGELFWYDAVALAEGEDAARTLKTVPYDEWRAAMERGRRPSTPGSPLAPLNPAELGSLARHRLISIGGHSHRHPILARADDVDERDEIASNLAALAAWTGERPRAFAYPNGRRGADYSERTERTLAACGVDLAFGTDEGFAAADAAPFALPRYMMTAGLTAPHLLNRLARVWR